MFISDDKWMYGKEIRIMHKSSVYAKRLLAAAPIPGYSASQIV